MLEESFGLLFYLKKPKNYSKGLLPIYLRITVDGIVKELSLNRRWEKHRWNSNASKPIGTKEDARELTMFLEALQVKVYQVKRQIMEAGEQITASLVMDFVSGKQQRGKMLLKIFRDHNDRMKALIGKDYAKERIQGLKLL
ncbi:Arm DNA-binding domain-containing protein [Segetibacter koreensis]|uniref:Arm DNA-binding domain-containing protein n=1 Tax=Segetibacter koreensis TaxID=398037 RepID=UPI001B7FC9AC|nr:Arm DNA-binding domain-containing protein [Segetibacter koreensis]